MTILALDLGTNTGWAIRSPAGVSSGTQKFAPRARDAAGDRLLRFARWLTSMKAEGFELVVYEKAVGHYRSLGAQQLFPQFEAVLLLWCARHVIPAKPINQSTLKKLATGYGRGDKDDVVRAVRGMGFNPADSNEADALALLLTETGALKCEPRAKPKRPSKRKRDGVSRELLPEAEAPPS